MFTKMTAATLLACLAALGACGGSAAREAPPHSPASFQIVYERGGGFAPSTSKLVVRPGRHAIAAASGGRAGEQTVRFRIGRARVVALEQGLRRAHFGRLHSAASNTCADCYFYEIAYRGHRVEFDESQLPPELGEVVGELESIVTAHAIPPNA